MIDWDTLGTDEYKVAASLVTVDVGPRGSQVLIAGVPHWGISSNDRATAAAIRLRLAIAQALLRMRVAPAGMACSDSATPRCDGGSWTGDRCKRS